MSIALNTSIEPPFRTIDGLKIRFAESEQRDDHALLLSPWPTSEPATRSSRRSPAGVPDPSKLARLSAISQPTLVANGDDDSMMITENSRLLARHLPNAQLRVYPDAGHGFLDQYPEEFAEDVNAFLNGG
jgi:pimeloyl-ACP methyl ester carboxylesterase